MNKTEAIRGFLQVKTHKDLATLYTPNMECQVNVAQDGGERIEGDYQGKLWQGWTDGVTTWKSFRIPYKAYSDPEYKDSDIRFNLEQHVEAIGMTGWDWQNRVSKWVAFDFDAIVGHKSNKTVSDLDLQSVIDAATKIDWVTIRRSTSGNGLHLYVKLPNVPTENHTEHSALARSVLGLMSALTGYDFQVKVDVCGSNMWVWHRKMKGTNGLTVIKEGGVCNDFPPNWKDHVPVVTGKKHRAVPEGGSDELEELINNYAVIALDSNHQKLLHWLKENEKFWWWDADRHILVAHTFDLKTAHKELGMIGIFDTLSEGSNTKEQNCFCNPLSNGAWIVRRFTPGVNEASNWEQDGSGWTRTYLNKLPTFGIACRTYNGLENEKGSFVFRTARDAIAAGLALNVKIAASEETMLRKTTLRLHKDGRIIVEMEHDPNDIADKMHGWLPDKNKWTKIFAYYETQVIEDSVNYDAMVRHLVSETDEDSGWAISRDSKWGVEPMSNIKIALSLNLSPKIVNTVLGSSVLGPYKLVNKPFQPEYPGNREWNRDGAQLRFDPLLPDADKQYPHWTMVLEHCGEALTPVIKNNPWARANGILTGGDYLKIWVACVLQKPTELLPFLFFYSPEQNTGKSIFHESLDLLMTKGYIKANEALTSSSAFNGELAGALICVIEELDLNGNKVAYNRLKDWVTGRKISIRPIYQQSYMATNTTHWICCTNDHRYCPIFPGDTRIVVARVNPLPASRLIPKPVLEAKLVAEAPAFLAEVLRLEIPKSNDRLALPVISSADKEIVESLNRPVLDTFLDECYEYCPGGTISFREVFETFVSWADADDCHTWTKIKFSKNLPPQYPVGKIHGSADKFVGNIRKAGTMVLPTGTLHLHGMYLEVN